MNPYQIIGIMFSCAIVFGVVVAVLTMLGVPLLIAFLGVYLSTVWFMMGLQRRAQESSPETQGQYSLAMRYDHSIMAQKSAAYNSQVDNNGAPARG